MMIKRFFIICAGLMATWAANATRYYISPTGNDANNGLSPKRAFATMGAAQVLVEAGDTVMIMPGTYIVTEEECMSEENSGKSGQYKIIYHFKKSGDIGKPICYIGQTDADGNRPVFDFSNVKPENWRVTAFLVNADFLLFKNFEVIGIQVNRTDHTQSENIRVSNGSFNTFENIACHDGMGIGFYLTRNSANNLFVNCDGYNNYDPISDVNEKTGLGSGGNNDGFGCHVNVDSPSNLFIGCRAWNNADDGFDLIDCLSAATLCYSIAYRNGYDAENKGRGDGNGFKAGGYGMDTVQVALPNGGAPMHKVYHCIAASNKANGIYSNHHLGGVMFQDNTAYCNGSFNYQMVNRQGAGKDEALDVNGYDHWVVRNLSMVSDGKENHVSYLRGDEGGNIIDGNSFYWVDKNSGGWAYTIYGNSIFQSTKVSDFTVARDANGMLSAATLAVMNQKDYLGLGCSFEDYPEAIDKARTLAGAQIGMETTDMKMVKIQAEGESDIFYDLQGRHIPTPGKGIYIRHGKKIVIKR